MVMEYAGLGRVQGIAIWCMKNAIRESGSHILRDSAHFMQSTRSVERLVT
jgi:hypothetical protein